VGGPASSTDNAVVRYDGTGGNNLQDSTVFIDDSGNVRIGAAPAAVPLDHTLKIGQDSRVAVDVNTGGSVGTVQSGNGTGTGIQSSLIFQTPTLTGSGSGAQTQTTRLTLHADGATFDVAIIANQGIQIADAKNVVLNTSTGTKWGTATTQKQAWWNATPVVQPTAVADASGGAIIDVEGRAALNALLARLRTLGIIAT
jgi:hypothetical protein